MNKVRILSVLALLALMIAAVGVAPAHAYVSCNAGSYDASGGSLWNFTCTPAAPGYYVPYAGAYSQTPCSVGTYQPNSGQTYCLTADAGYYVGGTASAVEAPCPAGTYQPYTGAAGCNTDLPGYYSGQAATQQTACPPGTFQPNYGASDCLTTQAGYYSLAAATSPTPCPAGYYQPLTGQSGCAQASPGHYAAGTGNASQTACALGSYQPLPGKTSCILADANYYVAAVGSATETACPAGDISPAGSTSLSDCVPSDTTPPTITLNTPANGASYLLNQAVIADYSCQDEAGGSGLASCVGTVASGAAIDTTSVGSYSFSVNAADNAGNPASASASYSVGYGFSGFLAPVDNAPTVNTGKAGKTYPVKWQLTDANGAFISALSAVSSVTYKATSCSAFTGDSSDALETTSTSSAGLRYDSTANQFVYNWATPAAGCYTLFVKLDSGQILSAFFNLSK